jgi:hypothetical protein
MVAVRHTVPYQIDVRANDNATGKPLVNTFYARSAVATAALGYGDPIPGSNQSTFLTAFFVLWETAVVPLLNANYRMVSYTCQAILGKRFKTPFQPILALAPGAPIQIVTSTPHGLVTGAAVFISGVTSPPSVNKSWLITVTSPTDFTLNGSNDALLWSGDGQWQVASGKLQFNYADKLVASSSAAGGVVGDALPLINTGSIRRINTGTGRSFRSRVSVGPMSEADSVDGGFTAGTKTAWAAALAAFNVAMTNGSADATAQYMYHCVVSKLVASTQPPTFVSYYPWSWLVNNFILQRNTGSLLRRKPRLTSIVA